MPESVPSYRQRSGSNQAIVTLQDAVTKVRRDYWLGDFDTPESRERYHRLIAQWEAQGRVLPAPEQLPGGPKKITVEEIINSYRKWAESYYTASEATTIKMALRVLRQFYGTTPAEEFGPKAMRAVREAMVRGDPAADPPHVAWSRPHINKQVHRIGAMFKWAASHELLPVTVYQQLKTMEPLKRGRCTAREPEPVLPVPEHLIDPLKDFVSDQVWAIIQIQRLTGARCGELFTLRRMDLKMDDPSGVWTWTPAEHKTAHHGKRRTIYFGPRTQEVIKPFFENRPAEHCLFSPFEAEAARRAKMHAMRKTPLSYGNRPGTNKLALPSRMPGDHYTTDSYRRAIASACRKAFPPPEHLKRGRVKGRKCGKGTRWETAAEWKARLGPEKWAELDRWQHDHGWHPHQLRHTAGTNIRRQYGLEAAQLALGHSSALVTEAV
jgi:integrase